MNGSPSCKTKPLSKHAVGCVVHGTHDDATHALELDDLFISSRLTSASSISLAVVASPGFTQHRRYETSVDHADFCPPLPSARVAPSTRTDADADAAVAIFTLPPRTPSPREDISSYAPRPSSIVNDELVSSSSPMNCAITSASLTRSLLLALAAAAFAARDLPSLPELVDRGLHGIPRPGVECFDAGDDSSLAFDFVPPFDGVAGATTPSVASLDALPTAFETSPIRLSRALSSTRTDAPSRARALVDASSSSSS
jgi:hypothetical protein